MWYYNNMIYYLNYEEEQLSGCNERDISQALLKFIIDEKQVDHYLIRKEKFGKPFIEGHPFHFSISHTRGFCGIAVSDSRIGFDAERKDRKLTNSLLKRICTRDELNCIRGDEDALRLWVLKEACVKFTGRGIMQILEGIELDYGTLSSKDGRLKCHMIELDHIVMATCQETDYSHELSILTVKDIERYL